VKSVGCCEAFTDFRHTLCGWCLDLVGLHEGVVLREEVVVLRGDLIPDALGLGGTDDLHTVGPQVMFNLEKRFIENLKKVVAPDVHVRGVRFVEVVPDVTPVYGEHLVRGGIGTDVGIDIHHPPMVVTTIEHEFVVLIIYNPIFVIFGVHHVGYWFVVGYIFYI
jgi:hypothetical protein